MIHFNELPDTGSMNTLIEGKHKVRIENAEMKQPKDINKPPYLNITLQVIDDSGNSIGKIWDILSESDKPLVMFKLKRFIIGFGIPITGDFELKDLCKVVKGKEAYAELKIQTSDAYPDKTVVDATKDDIYYPIDAVEAVKEDLPNIKIADTSTIDTVEAVEEDLPDAMTADTSNEEF